MKIRWTVSILLAVFLLPLADSSFAQTSPQKAAAQPQQSTADLKVDVESWSESTEPFHVVGPIYYVGTRGLGVYLFATPAGHILLGGAVPGTAPLIEASIRKLGYKPEDIRILLLNHAHFDHAGTLADFKKLTGARVEVMDEDVYLLKSGGKGDYLFASDPKFHFAAVTVDRVLKDGDTVSLGNVQLTAHHTPGHTRGCTTWTTTVKDGGRSYSVVFPDGTSVNPGTRLVKAPSYPGITDDYRHTFTVLESLHPDIYLAYHAEFFDPQGKRARAATEGVQAWVDREGYRRKIAETKARFEHLVAQESTGTSAFRSLAEAKTGTVTFTSVPNGKGRLISTVLVGAEPGNAHTRAEDNEMPKAVGFALLILFALHAVAANKETGTTVLKDVQPAGTTGKNHKHQQYDLSLSTTSGTDYTCRTSEKNQIKATDFVVGTNVTYEFKDNKGKLKTSAGKKADCTVVRVANSVVPPK